MHAIVSLSVPENGLEDKTVVENVADRDHLIYVDSDNARCEIVIDAQGLCMVRGCHDHTLRLNLKEDAYAEVVTAEGNLRIEAKVIDFETNNDILVMQYIINDVTRILKIKYY